MIALLILDNFCCLIFWLNFCTVASTNLLTDLPLNWLSAWLIGRLIDCLFNWLMTSSVDWSMIAELLGKKMWSKVKAQLTEVIKAGADVPSKEGKKINLHFFQSTKC